MNLGERIPYRCKGTLKQQRDVMLRTASIDKKTESIVWVLAVSCCISFYLHRRGPYYSEAFGCAKRYRRSSTSSSARNAGILNPIGFVPLEVPGKFVCKRVSEWVSEMHVLIGRDHHSKLPII